VYKIAQIFQHAKFFSFLRNLCSHSIFKANPLLEPLLQVQIAIHPTTILCYYNGLCEHKFFKFVFKNKFWKGETYKTKPFLELSRFVGYGIVQPKE
jgi:hypothetical protein